MLAQEQGDAAPESLAATRFLLARSLVAAPRDANTTTRRAQARALAEAALAAERLVPGHAAQVAAISAWLAALAR